MYYTYPLSFSVCFLFCASLYSVFGLLSPSLSPHFLSFSSSTCLSSLSFCRSLPDLCVVKTREALFRGLSHCKGNKTP